MAMITKTQAGVIFTAAQLAAIAALPQKIDDALRTAAANGIVSIVFPYAPATSAQADAFIIATMTPAGWTAINNNLITPGNFTITIS